MDNDYDDDGDDSVAVVLYRVLFADKDEDEDEGNHDDYDDDGRDNDYDRDVRPLLEEMCCQRIAQDFQLVERVTQDGSAPGTAAQVIPQQHCRLFSLISCTQALICDTILLQVIVLPVSRTVLTDPGQGVEHYVFSWHSSYPDTAY